MSTKQVKIIPKGSVFGKLTVIDENHIMSNTKTPRASFKVQCKCGTKFYATGTYLRRGVITSCKNCSFKDRELNKNLIVPQLEQLYNHNIVIRCRDSKKQIDNNLSLEEFILLSNQNCYYCNEPPSPSMKFKKRKFLNTEEIKINGIDRIDSNIGYSLSNCVSCCTTCNKMKMDLPQNIFIEKIEKIMNNLKNRNH